MLKKSSILFCIIFICACSSKNKIPNDILSVNQMKTVMWDLLKANELAVNDTIHNRTISFKDSSIAFTKKVLQLHHLDKENFYKSYNFYSGNPPVQAVLFDSISAVADRERNSLYSHPYNPNYKPDTARLNKMNKIFRKNIHIPFKQRDSLQRKLPI